MAYSNGSEPSLYPQQSHEYDNVCAYAFLYLHILLNGGLFMSVLLQHWRRELTLIPDRQVSVVIRHSPRKFVVPLHCNGLLLCSVHCILQGYSNGTGDPPRTPPMQVRPQFLCTCKVLNCSELAEGLRPDDL